jgi:hypothetical protein
MSEFKPLQHMVDNLGAGEVAGRQTPSIHRLAGRGASAASRRFSRTDRLGNRLVT